MWPVSLTQSSWTELGRGVSIGTIATHGFWGLSATSKIPPQVLFRRRSISCGEPRGMGVASPIPSPCDRGGLRFQLGAITIDWSTYRIDANPENYWAVSTHL